MGRLLLMSAALVASLAVASVQGCNVATPVFEKSSGGAAGTFGSGGSKPNTTSAIGGSKSVSDGEGGAADEGKGGAPDEGKGGASDGAPGGSRSSGPRANAGADGEPDDATATSGGGASGTPENSGGATTGGTISGQGGEAVILPDCLPGVWDEGTWDGACWQ